MIGIDVVDVERLRAALGRTPRLERRLFTDLERSYCRSKGDPARHFAGTLAAKEAVIKAALIGPLMAWAGRIEIWRDNEGIPRVRIEGADAPHVSVSISHDGPVAAAVAIDTSGPSRST